MPDGVVVSLTALLPELLLVIAACAVLLVGPGRREGGGAAPVLTLVALLLALIVLRFGETLGIRGGSGGGLSFDELAKYVRTSTAVIGILITMAAWSQPAAGERGEFFAMMLFSLSGLMLVGASSDLVTLFLALELVSIPAYTLVTLSRTDLKALEAGTKYFYLGAMAAAINAYGFSFLYGVAGSADLGDVTRAVASALAKPAQVLPYTLAMLGVTLSVAGLLFKIAAFPLHFYIGDVYQGAAAPVAGMLGYVPKLAGFVAILKVVAATNVWRGGDVPLFWVLWWVAVLSMTIGNTLALMQTNVRRMLAYSGIAHSGYMLVGLIAGPLAGPGVIGDGAAAILYYTVIYGIANLGAFTLLGLLRVRGEPAETVRDLAGLLRRHPGLALLMALAMLTLMGLPPTPGFWGKMALFGSALASVKDSGPLNQWVVALVVIAVINTAVAAAYYLRVVASLLLYENDEPAEARQADAPQMGVVLCGFLLLIFAFFPNALMNFGRAASGPLRAQATPMRLDVPVQSHPPDAGHVHPS
ncbi:NADH-quinone oxidoreductase subunit N [Phycisphaerae bacterium RAS1]|nr:NADH-quinone oxidoreductase subunit N [Phycisphaerae bacterium RAS1]